MNENKITNVAHSLSKSKKSKKCNYLRNVQDLNLQLSCREQALQTSKEREGADKDVIGVTDKSESRGLRERE